MKLRILLQLTAFVGFAVCGARPALAQSIRVSVKYIQDVNGNRPSGFYNSNASVSSAIAQANTVLSNNGFLWDLQLIEILEVHGVSQHFDLASTGDVHDALEADALADPATYFWQTDAINFYIVNSIPGVGGLCSFPMQHDIIAINSTGGILGDGVGWLHEIGHYLSLTHTFEECGCTPGCVLPCTGAGASHDGTCAGVIDCPDTCPDTNNVMSYNSFPLASATLSTCQKENMEFELFDPLGVRSNVIQCEPVLALTPGSDLEILLPFACNGGIASLTAGTYNNAPFTMRGHYTIVPSGGVVLIQ